MGLFDGVGKLLKGAGKAVVNVVEGGESAGDGEGAGNEGDFSLYDSVLKLHRFKMELKVNSDSLRDMKARLGAEGAEGEGEQEGARGAKGEGEAGGEEGVGGEGKNEALGRLNEEVKSCREKVGKLHKHICTSVGKCSVEKIGENNGGINAFHFVCLYNMSGVLEKCVKRLECFGAYALRSKRDKINKILNDKDVKGVTPLMLMAKNGYYKYLISFVRFGWSDLTCVADDGRSCLSISLKKCAVNDTSDVGIFVNKSIINIMGNFRKIREHNWIDVYNLFAYRTSNTGGEGEDDDNTFLQLLYAKGYYDILGDLCDDNNFIREETVDLVKTKKEFILCLNHVNRGGEFMLRNILRDWKVKGFAKNRKIGSIDEKGMNAFRHDRSVLHAALTHCARENLMSVGADGNSILHLAVINGIGTAFIEKVIELCGKDDEMIKVMNGCNEEGETWLTLLSDNVEMIVNFVLAKFNVDKILETWDAGYIIRKYSASTK